MPGQLHLKLTGEGLLDQISNLDVLGGGRGINAPGPSRQSPNKRAQSGKDANPIALLARPILSPCAMIDDCAVDLERASIPLETLSRICKGLNNAPVCFAIPLRPHPGLFYCCISDFGPDSHAAQCPELGCRQCASRGTRPGRWARCSTSQWSHPVSGPGSATHGCARTATGCFDAADGMEQLELLCRQGG